MDNAMAEMASQKPLEAQEALSELADRCEQAD